MASWWPPGAPLIFQPHGHQMGRKLTANLGTRGPRVAQAASRSVIPSFPVNFLTLPARKCSRVALPSPHRPSATFHRVLAETLEKLVWPEARGVPFRVRPHGALWRQHPPPSFVGGTKRNLKTSIAVDMGKMMGKAGRPKTFFLIKNYWPHALAHLGCITLALGRWRWEDCHELEAA